MTALGTTAPKSISDTAHPFRRSMTFGYWDDTLRGQDPAFDAGKRIE
ncbi:hypothetical protein ACPZ19_03420 [Amycolatopsis lurida]